MTALTVVYTNAHVHEHIHTHIYICILTHMLALIHTCIHTCAYVFGVFACRFIEEYVCVTIMNGELCCVLTDCVAVQIILWETSTPSGKCLCTFSLLDTEAIVNISRCQCFMLSFLSYFFFSFFFLLFSNYFLKCVFCLYDVCMPELLIKKRFNLVAVAKDNTCHGSVAVLTLVLLVMSFNTVGFKCQIM